MPLYTSDDELSIGVHDWRLLASQLDEYSILYRRPVRNVESVKKTMSHLVTVKKPTGNSSCPPTIRRTKHILLCNPDRVIAINVGDTFSRKRAKTTYSRKRSPHLKGVAALLQRRVAKYCKLGRRQAEL